MFHIFDSVKSSRALDRKVMQAEVIKAVLEFGQFYYTDHLLLNVMTCACGQFQCEKIKEEVQCHRHKSNKLT